MLCFVQFVENQGLDSEQERRSYLPRDALDLSLSIMVSRAYFLSVFQLARAGGFGTAAGAPAR